MRSDSNNFENGSIYIQSLWDWAAKSIQTFFINNIGILTLYSTMVEWGKSKIRQLYFEYPLVEENMNKIMYYFSYAKSICFHYRIEPIEENWITTTMLTKKQSSDADIYNFKYYESYVKLIPSLLYNYRVVSRQYQESCSLSLDYLNSTQESNDILEMLTILKYENQYITHSCSPAMPTEVKHLRLPVEYSNVSFLSIVYSHPSMVDKIVLELDNKYYITNNCLFTPLFTKRLLEYNSSPYFFDMDYTLDFMDDDLNVFSLTSGQYIQLNEKGYVIKGETQVSPQPPSY